MLSEINTAPLLLYINETEQSASGSQQQQMVQNAYILFMAKKIQVRQNAPFSEFHSTCMHFSHNVTTSSDVNLTWCPGADSGLSLEASVEDVCFCADICIFFVLFFRRTDQVLPVFNQNTGPKPLELPVFAQIAGWKKNHLLH